MKINLSTQNQTAHLQKCNSEKSAVYRDKMACSIYWVAPPLENATIMFLPEELDCSM